jgi:hypothetical protein
MTDKITSFNKQNLRALFAEVEKALAPLAEKHGLKLERKHCSFRDDELPVAFKFITVKIDANGNAMDTRAKDFIKYASLYGLSEKDFLAEFTSNGDRFRITGFKPKARKYPVLAENVRTGKTYKFPVERVKAALAQAKAA